MAYREAKRKAVPLLVALTGTSGSGKTFSALLMAAGMAGEGGKVGLLDSEAGRGEMYADDPDIIAAMPGNKYYYDEITPPFTPEKYGRAIKEAAQSGITVLVIDSTSHEYEGMGGLEEMAANEKTGWMKPKMRHRREFMNVVTQSSMDLIFCLREREKVKVVKDAETGKDKHINIGMQPIQEKNFMYEMTLSMRFDCERPGKPIITKCPKPLLPLFLGDQAIITKDAGAKVKLWAQKGEQIDLRLRELMAESREAAMFGTERLNAFLTKLEKSDSIMLAKLCTQAFKDEVRALAVEADVVNASEEMPERAKLFND